MNHVIPVTHRLFDIPVCVWTFFHCKQKPDPSLISPSSSTLLTCSFWQIWCHYAGAGKLFTSHFPAKVCPACLLFFPHHLASHLHILILSYLGVALCNVCFLLLATEQLLGFFFLAWENFSVGILMVRKALLIQLFQVQIFLTGAEDSERSQTSDGLRSLSRCW